MKAAELFKRAAELNASDLFLMPGLPLTFKLNGRLMRQSPDALDAAQTGALIREIYALADKRSMDGMEQTGDDLFSFSVKGVARVRASIFREQGEAAAVLRLLDPEPPTPDSLHLPENLLDIARMERGLVLVTGPAGCGKTSTLACIVDEINRTRAVHILTLEQPVEYLHRHRQGVVTQREIGRDSESFEAALNAVPWQAPDVLLIGELHGPETVLAALAAAETGCLVLTSLPTIGTANTIDYIETVFPADRRPQVRERLASLLAAAVSQQLLPTLDGREEPAFELAFPNRAMRALIREGKTRQLDSAVRAGEGMLVMDDSLLALYRGRVISRDTLLDRCADPEMMERRIARD